MYKQTTHDHGTRWLPLSVIDNSAVKQTGCCAISIDSRRFCWPKKMRESCRTGSETANMSASPPRHKSVILLFPWRTWPSYDIETAERIPDSAPDGMLACIPEENRKKPCLAPRSLFFSLSFEIPEWVDPDLYSGSDTILCGVGRHRKSIAIPIRLPRQSYQLFISFRCVEIVEASAQ